MVMRIALSILVCVIAAVFFSLSAQASYSEEFESYTKCKNQYANGSCDAVPMFSKKALIEQSATCRLSPEIFASLESSITCSTVNSINKSCVDKFQPQVKQLISNHCATESRTATQAAAAALQGSAGGSQAAKSKDSNGSDLMNLAKTVGKPLAAATGLTGKIEEYGKKVIKDGGFSNPFKKDEGKVGFESTSAPAQQPTGNVNSNASVDTTSQLKGDDAKGLTTPNFDVPKKTSVGDNSPVTNDTTKNESAPSSDTQKFDGPATAAETTTKQAEMKDAEQKAVAAAPVIKDPAAKLAEASKPGVPEKAAEGASTEITQTAAEANALILSEIKATSAKGTQLVSDPVFPFSQTKAAVDSSAEKINKYLETVKKTCTGASEKAGFLCLEGTSPGMKTAKTTMDVAGPALAMINSAQKSCSATADVSRLVGTGLAIAKGVCVAAKLYCDFSCSAAVAAIAKTRTEIATNISQAFAKDVNNAQSVAAGAGPALEAKINGLIAKNAALAQQLNAELITSLEKEMVPTNPGTSAGTVVKCEGHMKDIGLLAMNIAGTFKAQQNAKACADKLKTGGEGPSVAEYCAQPANVSSDYCKCQRDSSQMGCSGHIVSSSTFNRPSDDKGSVQRSGSGASGFAGPGVGVSKIDAGNIQSPIAGGTSDLGVSGKVNDSSSGSASNKGAGSGSSGAASMGAGGGNTNPELANTDEKKKWSFGAFSGAFGGFGGGSSSGKGAAGSSKIGQKDLNAQRALASEKQWRSEVTESSGKSNFEKVKESYLKKTTTLLEK